MADPNGANATLWRGAPQTAGAFGNNPMAAPHEVAPEPKWLSSMINAANAIGSAISAPANALNGKYSPVIDPSAPGGVDSYSSMIPDAMTLSGIATTGAVPFSTEGTVLRAGMGLRPSDVPALPMDEASRIARAKAMGFRTSMPLYHGSDQAFAAFDPTRGGATTGAAPSQLGGVWAALDPATADEFAALAQKAHQGNAQVYPLLHRAQKPGLIDLDGTETNLEVAGALRDAFDSGHDAVMLRNYTTPGGQTEKKIIVVRNPQQLRSPHAVFDPEKKDLNDLLYRRGGAVDDHVGAALVLARDPDAHTGPITSTVAGRTDQHAIDVPAESFVIPADVVSALGEGNTNNGMEILTRMFGKKTRTPGNAGNGVPIMAAGGEFVVGPQAVARVGGGDLKRGHKNLRDFVLGVRREHVATLRKLKGPHR